MSDRPDAWMPLYIADYLRDTSHLSATEHGAYLLLLMHAWTNRGLLPLDERRWARIARLDRADWDECRDMVMEFFERHEDGYRHKRIDAELARAEAKLEQQRAAGRASAAKRASQRPLNDRSTPVGTDATTDVPTATPTDGQREGQRGPQREGNPSPSPSSSLRSEEYVDGGVACADAPASARSHEPAHEGSLPDPTDLIRLTDEVCRTAGIRHVEPGPIIRHQELVKGWLDEGFDPQADILPAVRAGIATATEAVNSLKYFDRAIRQTKAKREAGHDHAHRNDDEPTNPILAASLARRRERARQAGDGDAVPRLGRA